MASSLTDLAIAVGYPQLLHIDGGVTSSLASVYDGDGTATPLKISTTAVQIIDGSYDFDIASHDGTNGLKLGGTLVTATAAEINALSGLSINSTQLNYLDITTLGTAEASKAVTTDANVDITGLRNITGTGTATFANFVASGDTTIGDGDTDNITINADINSNLIPNVDNSFDLGTSSKQWKDLYLNGVAYVDSVDLEGDILLKAQGDVRFYDSDSSNYVALQSPGTIASNYTLSLPDADGSNKQLLRTDGAGALSFAFADRLNQPARNVSGSTISAGTPVYVTGYNSGENRVTIAPSDANDSATMPAIGITTADISNNANGEISITGIVESIDTSSFSAGDTLYVANGGGLTATKPTGTYLIQNIAHVLRSHASAGEIQVISTYRTNDLPNIAEDAVWIGNSSGVPTATDFDTVLSTRLATTSVKGIASFSSDNFDVTSGVVTIKDNGVALATETTGDFVNSITGGTGIDSTGATSGENISHTLSLNLNELTTETTIADADFIAMVDATDNGSGKITFENLEDAIFASVSGDINIAEDGTATIQANSVALATDTTGDFVASITAGTGLTSTGATSGENIAHSLSVDASQTQITAVGALGTGSISSGFGNIDIGSSDLTATGTVSLGASSFNDNNITNVGDIALDSISADGSTINVAIGDNTSDVFTIKQSTNKYFAIDTSDTAENIAIGTGVSGTAISIGHSTSTTTVNDDLIVTGDLTVNGATTTLNTTNSVISDTLIELGNGTTGTPANDSGIVIERGDANNAFLGFDESDDKFIVGTGTFSGASTGSLTITTGTLKANIEGSLDVSSSTLTTSAAQNLAIMQGANSNVDIGAFKMTASHFESDVATGTAPIIVASTTKVANLNADLLDDQTGSYYLDFSNFVVDDNEISGDKINGGTIDSITITALAGAVDLGTNNITNIGSVALTTLESSSTGAGFTVSLVDNVDPAITIKQGTTEYMKITTSDGGESIEFHKPVEFGTNVGTMNFNSNNMTNVDIDSGTIDGTTIGASSASTGAFTTISASGNVDFNGDLDVDGTTNLDVVDIDGATTITGTSAYASSATNLSTSVSKMALRVQGSNDASTSLWMGALEDDAQQYIQACNDAGNGADDIVLNPFGGRVGVGVGNASPSSGLHLQGGDNTASKFTLTNTANSNSWSIHPQYNDQTLRFLGDSTTVLTMKDTGEVGIGVATPESKLAVKGSSGDADLFSISDVAVPTSGAEYGTAMIKTNSTEYALNITSYNANGKGLRIYNNGGQNAFLVTQAGGDRFVVDGSGNVGIGDNSPSAKLTINGGINNVYSYSTTTTDQPGFVAANHESSYTNLIYSKIYGSGVSASAFGVTLGNYGICATDGSSNNGLIVGTFSNKPIIVGTNSTERMRIESDGTFTFKNTSARFNFYADSTTDIVQYFGGHDTDGDIRIAASVAVATTAGSNACDGELIFATASGNTNTERMRITSGGRLIAGGGAPEGSHSERLGVKCLDRYGIFVSDNMSSGTTTIMRMYDTNAPNVVGSITSTSSGTAYNSSSDYRLKENEVLISDGLTRLNQLKPYRFNFIADADTTVDGFFAHEVAEVVPEAITGEKDAIDDDGNIKPQGIDQSKLVPLLVKALQEADDKIDALTARIEALEA